MEIHALYVRTITVSALILFALAFAPAPFAGQQTTDDAIYKVGEDVTAPRLIHQVLPVFPDEARAAKVTTGTVVLDSVVRKDGTVQVRGIQKTSVNCPQECDQAKIESSMSHNALEAAEQWTFEPAKKGDAPVNVRLFIEVNFNWRP